jgi:hypothetical protein
MKRIIVTADLLHRYHLGGCTENERKAVVEWMLDGISDASAPVPPHNAQSDIENDIWKEIEKQRVVNVKPGKITHDLFRYRRWGIAACLTLLIALGFQVSDGKQLNIDNMKGEETKIIAQNGLVFRLAPKSSVEAQRSFWGTEGRIRFCGSMEIINETGRDINLIFNSTCKKSDYTLKKMTCKSGSSYIALHHFLTQDEIIIMNSRRGESDLPGAVTI